MANRKPRYVLVDYTNTIAHVLEESNGSLHIVGSFDSSAIKKPSDPLAKPGVVHFVDTDRFAFPAERTAAVDGQIETYTQFIFINYDGSFSSSRNVKTVAEGLASSGTAWGVYGIENLLIPYSLSGVDHTGNISVNITTSGSLNQINANLTPNTATHVKGLALSPDKEVLVRFGNTGTSANVYAPKLTRVAGENFDRYLEVGNYKTLSTTKNIHGGDWSTDSTLFTGITDAREMVSYVYDSATKTLGAQISGVPPFPVTASDSLVHIVRDPATDRGFFVTKFDGTAYTTYHIDQATPGTYTLVSTLSGFGKLLNCTIDGKILFDANLKKAYSRDVAANSYTELPDFFVNTTSTYGAQFVTPDAEEVLAVELSGDAALTPPYAEIQAETPNKASIDAHMTAMGVEFDVRRSTVSASTLTIETTPVQSAPIKLDIQTPMFSGRGIVEVPQIAEIESSLSAFEVASYVVTGPSAIGEVILPKFSTEGEVRGEFYFSLDAHLGSFKSNLSLQVERTANVEAQLPLFDADGMSNWLAEVAGELPKFTSEIIVTNDYTQVILEASIPRPSTEITTNQENYAELEAVLHAFEAEIDSLQQNYFNSHVTLPTFSGEGESKQDSYSTGDVEFPIISGQVETKQDSYSEGEVALPLISSEVETKQNSYLSVETDLPTFIATGYTTDLMEGDLFATLRTFQGGGQATVESPSSGGRRRGYMRFGMYIRFA